MENGIYKVVKEEKLSDLADKFKTSKEYLKNLNPEMKIFSSFFSKDEYVAVNQIIKIPVVKLSEDLSLKQNNLSEEEMFLENMVFDQQARYRCEQINSTYIENEIMSYTHQKKEYSVKYNFNDNLLKISLEDHFHESNPSVLSHVFEYISKVEKIRNNVMIQFDEEGRFKSIRDIKALKKNWLNFKKNDLDKIEFIQKIKEMKPEEYNFMLKEGDRQFDASYDHKSDFDRDLFYFVLMDKYLKFDDLLSERYTYKSQLLPSLDVPMNTRYDILKKDEDWVTVRKVSETIFSEELLQKLENSYNQYHKPLIKYRFTEYKLDIRNTFTYNKKTKLLQKAEVSIIENIENNIRSEVKYSLKIVN